MERLIGRMHAINLFCKLTKSAFSAAKFQFSGYSPILGCSYEDVDITNIRSILDHEIVLSYKIPHIYICWRGMWNYLMGQIQKVQSWISFLIPGRSCSRKY